MAGSFCETAAERLVKQEFESVYLATSARVTQALVDAEIDYGVIAIGNSIGGVVLESIYALAPHRLQILERAEIPISQNLMAKSKLGLAEIVQVYSHPQALKQAAEFLQANCPQAELVEAADTALAAQRLAAGELSAATAVIGNIKCAELYGLEVLQVDVQATADNRTQFVLLKRGLDATP